MQSFERNLTAILPRLRRFAHTLAGSPADADDLTQATAERILRSRHLWRGGAGFDAWTYRIMRNLWIDTRRSTARTERRLAPEEAGMAVGYDPRQQIEHRAELARLMSALDQLPDEQREVIALVSIEGFGYGEVANMLDLPIGTVSTRVMRGRQALLGLLEDKHDR